MDSDWRAIEDIIVSGQTIRYTIWKSDIQLCFKDFIEAMLESKSFRHFYNQQLAKAPFPAFFWEHPPIGTSALHKAYEVVLVNSPRLAMLKPDSSPFRKHLSTQEAVTSFSNLGRDAQLVVPVALAGQPHEQYTHLANFAKYAHPAQQDSFWKRCAQAYQKDMKQGERWLSTSGLGVSWLHVRICSRPKYYTYQPYKD